MAATGDIYPAPRQRRVVDLRGVRRVPLRILVALLGRRVAVVQIAGARVVAAGVGRALVLHVRRDGLHRGLVGLRQKRLTRRAATATRRNRAGQRPVQLGDQDLAVPDILSVGIAAAAAMKDQRPSARIHHLVQIKANLPRLAATAAGEGQRARQLKARRTPTQVAQSQRRNLGVRAHVVVRLAPASYLDAGSVVETTGRFPEATEGTATRNTMTAPANHSATRGILALPNPHTRSRSFSPACADHRAPPILSPYRIRRRYSMADPTVKASLSTPRAAPYRSRCCPQRRRWASRSPPARR